MSRYQYLTQWDSPAHTKGRQGKSIEGIVIHHWGADGQKFENVVGYLTRSNADTSAHYVVEAGRVACIVDCANTAWHAGNWNVNLTTIGIECRPECTQADFETVADLIADIRKEYGILPLSRHSDHFNTACPGRWGARLTELSELANNKLKGLDKMDKDNIKLPTAKKGEPKPVYRLLGRDGHHLFTTSENEAKTLQLAGWKNEGVAFFAYEAKQ